MQILPIEHPTWLVNNKVSRFLSIPRDQEGHRDTGSRQEDDSNGIRRIFIENSKNNPYR